MAHNPGDQICGRFELVRAEAVGTGSPLFGDSWAAVDSESGEVARLVLLGPELIPDAAAREALVARLGKLCARGQDDVLVPLSFVGLDGEHVATAFEALYAGISLADAVADLEVGDRVSEIGRLIVDVALGLAILHSYGWVHGSLGIETIFIWERGNALWQHTLAGSCDPTALAARIAETGLLVAPEVAETGELSAASDVFAWALVIATYASGLPPEEALAALRRGEILGKSGKLLKLLQAAVDPSPSARPANGSLLVEGLQAAGLLIVGDEDEIDEEALTALAEAGLDPVMLEGLPPEVGAPAVSAEPVQVSAPAAPETPETAASVSPSAAPAEPATPAVSSKPAPVSSPAAPPAKPATPKSATPAEGAKQALPPPVRPAPPKPATPAVSSKPAPVSSPAAPPAKPATPKSAAPPAAPIKPATPKSAALAEGTKPASPHAALKPATPAKSAKPAQVSPPAAPPPRPKLPTPKPTGSVKPPVILPKLGTRPPKPATRPTAPPPQAKPAAVEGLPPLPEVGSSVLPPRPSLTERAEESGIPGIPQALPSPVPIASPGPDAPASEEGSGGVSPLGDAVAAALGGALPSLGEDLPPYLPPISETKEPLAARPAAVVVKGESEGEGESTEEREPEESKKRIHVLEPSNRSVSASTSASTESGALKTSALVNMALAGGRAAETPSLSDAVSAATAVQESGGRDRRTHPLGWAIEDIEAHPGASASEESDGAREGDSGAGDSAPSELHANDSVEARAIVEATTVGQQPGAEEKKEEDDSRSLLILLALAAAVLVGTVLWASN